MPALTFLLSFAGGYIFSLLFFFGRTLPFYWRTVLFILTALLTLVCPLCIPSRFPVARCLIAVTLVIFVFKSWDLYLHPARNKHLALRQYIPFLMNHCLFIANNTNCLLNREAVSSRLRHFLFETLYFFLSSMALFMIFRWNWSSHSFLAEHIVKSTASTIWLICAWDWYAAIWHLAGARTFKFTHNLLLAYSPAEFWRRCHCEAHRWLYVDVFKPLKGLMSPTPALLLTFAVSGLAHEYAISVALGRFTGYMLLFFLLNGLASVVTWRLKLSGIYKFMGVVLTFIFLTMSSVFFFIPVNEGISFYANQVPPWIKLW
jgi:hypothetical protein